MNAREALETIGPLAALPAAMKDRLASSARVRHVKRGKTFWQVGEQARSYSWVLEGRLKTVKTGADGHDAIVDMPAAGAMACASVPHTGLTWCCRAVSMDDETWVLSIDRRAVLDLASREPAFTMVLLEQVIREHGSLCRRVEELSGLRVPQRVARLLLRLADEVGNAEGDTTRVPARLTRQDLADLCGTTIETAIRVMRRLEAGGLVSTDLEGFYVLDRRGLEAVSTAGRFPPGV